MIYTIEVENRLLRSRQHRRNSLYRTLEEARNAAAEEASRCRSFATFNVLDERGNVVASFQGEK